MTPRRAVLHLVSWANVRHYDVLVVGETRARYRIRAEQDILLLGRIVLHAGQTALVPQSAITWSEP